MGNNYNYNRYNRGVGFQYGGKRKNYDDDDYYEKSRSRYGSRYGGSQSWSWGNFGSGFSYNDDEDEDEDLYVKNHESYFTPKNSSISAKLTHTENTKNNRRLIKEMSRFFFYNMMDDKEFFDEKFSDPSKLSEEEISQFETKKTFYEDLWDKFVPGVTPLDKALAIFAKLVEQQKEKRGKGDPSDLGEADASQIEFHEELYGDTVFNELLDTNHFSKQRKMNIFNKISLVKNLGSQFKIEKEIEEKIVANSSIISKKIMRDYSQIGNIDLYQKLMPTFNIKFLTKDLVVNVPIDKTEHKQKIIMLVDFSGSMQNTEKQEWVVAILVDRLRYVIKEEAEVYFSYFVDGIDDLHFTHLYDRKTVMDFWMHFSTHPNGGDTRLGDMVNYIKKQIEEGKLHNLNIDFGGDNPEILAINDGQDSVKTNNFVYKTNAVTVVDHVNEELKGLCVKNDGKYVFVSGKEAKTWSKQGEQLLKI